MKPNLYLDVDGVILFLKKGAIPYEYVDDFMFDFVLSSKHLFNKIYWLSCWTKTGSAERLYLEYPKLKDFEAIPLEWKILKTNAIDWSQPFIWLEDGVLTEERKIFHERAVANQHIWEIRPGEYAMLNRKD